MCNCFIKFNTLDRSLGFLRTGLDILQLNSQLLSLSRNMHKTENSKTYVENYGSHLQMYTNIRVITW